MENFRTCPICMEVPEAEIFQCSAGHVICQSCVSKVNGGLCPQCRVPLGTPKIRNRALEEILDGQDFECKFKDNGCSHLCKRQELMNHFSSCSHNPDTVPLCQQMGLGDCEFRLGFKSKAEVILHFESKHNILTTRTPDLSISPRWELAWTASSQKRKFDDSTSCMPRDQGSYIVSTDDLDTSPLFLIHRKLNYPIECFSFGCIKIWDSVTSLSTNYNANFTFNRDSSLNPYQEQSRVSRTNHPFPLGGTMTVYNIKEAHQLFEASPINIPTSLFQNIRFGSRSLDFMRVKITHDTGTDASCAIRNLRAALAMVCRNPSILPSMSPL